MKKSTIVRDKEQEQVYLTLLNEHFETVSLEKYNDAMMNIMFTDACDKVLGKNFAKKRISKRKEKKIKDYVSARIRGKYGKWVSLTNFKLKGINNIYFQTNLDRVFTVTGHGKLYGAYYHRVCGNIFYTAHCLERFEERADMDVYGYMIERMKEVLGAVPTSVDLLSALLMASPLEYGKREGHYHVSIMSGILVLEDFGDVFIAKTFLSQDMIKDVKWYKPQIDNADAMNSFSDVINSPCEQIDKPVLINDIQKEAQKLYNGDAS